MLDKLRALVAERALLGMQREMEALLQDIEKVLLRIARDTSSSKQRNKCRNKKRSLEGQLKKVAAKYNKIIASWRRSKVEAMRGRWWTWSAYFVNERWHQQHGTRQQDERGKPMGSGSSQEKRKVKKMGRMMENEKENPGALRA